jgi:Flp pilus assembly protein TadD
MSKSSADVSRPASAAADIPEIRRIASGDVSKGIAMAVQAKAAGASDPLIHQLVALGLKRQGRLEEAINELGLGLQLDPDNPRLTEEVGFCLLEVGRRFDAARVFAQAVRLDPQSPAASYGFAWSAERVGELDAAEAGFKRTLALDRRHADALAGLSGLAVRRRDWQSARNYALQAVVLNPRQTDALMNLARIDVGEGRFESAETRAKELADLPHLHPQARTNTRFILGDALDGQGRYEEAFAAYARGKAELEEAYAREFGGVSANTAYDGVQQILSEFQSWPPEARVKPKRASNDSPARSHAFLVGFPRSGTTLLEQVLAAHPDVVALDERPVMIDAETEFLTLGGGIERLGAVQGHSLAPLREAYWKRVEGFGLKPDGKVFIDKHPLSTFRLPLIFKLFPEARIIFALRDPRDVVFSCYRRSFNMNAAMYEFNSLERAARFYDAVMHAGQAYFESLPLEVHRIRYEDLVADFEATAKAACDFLNIEWTSDLKDFAKTASQRRQMATPSSTQVLRGLYSEGVGQWRNYAFAMGPALEILQPWVEAFGYGD